MKCKICQTNLNSTDQFCRRCGNQIIYRTYSADDITILWLIKLLESIEYRVKRCPENEKIIYIYRETPNNLILIINLFKNFLRCRAEFFLMEDELTYELLSEINERNSLNDGSVWYISADNSIKLIVTGRYIFHERMKEKDFINFFSSFLHDFDYEFLFIPHLKDSIEGQDFSIFQN